MFESIDHESKIKIGVLDIVHGDETQCILQIKPN